MERLITCAEFKEKTILIKACLAALNNSEFKDKKLIKKTLVRLIDSVRSALADRNDNYVAWLHGEACSFVHPNTGNRVDIEIGDDYEAIYNFLLYCCMLNNGEKTDDEFTEYLAYLVSRSVYEKEDC